MAQLDDEIEEMLNGLDAYEDVVCKVCDLMISKLEYMINRIPVGTITKPDYRERFRRIARKSWGVCDVLKDYEESFDLRGQICKNKIDSEKD